MKLSRLIAASLVATTLAMIAPQAPVYADGATSTRNILLLGAAAGALIIINHNKQVHARYAQDAATQASLAAQRDDAQTAYLNEKKAYAGEVALVVDLKNEVAYDKSVMDKQRQQIAVFQSASGSTTGNSNFAAQTTLVKPTPVGGTTQVAVTSYGWGTI
jgi:hypothetical protein